MAKSGTLPPFNPFTPRQLEIRDAIVELRRAGRREPTLSEIARYKGMKAHAYVGRVVHKLKVRGQYP